MRDEREIIQVEKVPSETLPLTKTLNSKCHNNAEVKNKDGQKNKRQDSPKKNKESRKKKYSSFLDESDSDNDKDLSSEDSDIDNGSSSECSKERMSQDEHISSRLSIKSSAKNKKW